MCHTNGSGSQIQHMTWYRIPTPVFTRKEMTSRESLEQNQRIGNGNKTSLSWSLHYFSAVYMLSSNKVGTILPRTHTHNFLLQFYWDDVCHKICNSILFSIRENFSCAVATSSLSSQIQSFLAFTIHKIVYSFPHEWNRFVLP